jgi:hypothetical protein
VEAQRFHPIKGRWFKSSPRNHGNRLRSAPFGLSRDYEGSRPFSHGKAPNRYPLQAESVLFRRFRDPRSVAGVCRHFIGSMIDPKNIRVARARPSPKMRVHIVCDVARSSNGNGRGNDATQIVTKSRSVAA